MLDAVVGKYLAWCARHRSPRTLQWYEGHLKGFLKRLGPAAAMPAAALRPFHVVEWVKLPVVRLIVFEPLQRMRPLNALPVELVELKLRVESVIWIAVAGSLSVVEPAAPEKL